MQVDEEAAGHTGLALEPEESSFGEHRQSTTDLLVDRYLRKVALVSTGKVQLMTIAGFDGRR